MPTTPASIIADALGAFTKAANLAVATAEKQAATEIAHANAEAEEARRERDEAIETLNAIRLEKKEWQRRMDGWKTSVDKSDMTIEHQNQTIAQLREEAQQWKGQLFRYEATSHRETQDWKEQYLRAEQERTRLAARVDELVAEQLSWNTLTNAQNNAYTPRIQHPDPFDASTSTTTTKRASTAVLPMQPRPTGSRSVPPVFEEYDEEPPVPRKTKAASTKPTGTSDRARAEAIPHQRSPTQQIANRTSRTPKQKTGNMTEERPEVLLVTRSSAAPRASTTQKDVQSQGLRLIRRVQAVIEVPVKEESDDDEGLPSDDAQSAGSAYDRPAKRTPGKSNQAPKTRRRSSIKARPTVIQSDEEGDEFESAFTNGHPARRRPEAESEDDDELIIGAEDNHRELYGTHRVIVTSEKNTPQRQRAATATSRPSTNTKKRKLEGDGGPTARGTAAKIARKKQ